MMGMGMGTGTESDIHSHIGMAIHSCIMVCVQIWWNFFQ
jgi:hypothetical protein